MLQGHADVVAEPAVRLDDLGSAPTASAPISALARKSAAVLRATYSACASTDGVGGQVLLAQLSGGHAAPAHRAQTTAAAPVDSAAAAAPAGEQQVADDDRRADPGGGDHRRSPATQRRLVDDVVVDEGRHVEQLDGQRAGRRPLLGASAARTGAGERPRPRCGPRGRGAAACPGAARRRRARSTCGTPHDGGVRSRSRTHSSSRSTSAHDSAVTRGPSANPSTAVAERGSRGRPGRAAGRGPAVAAIRSGSAPGRSQITIGASCVARREPAVRAPHGRRVERDDLHRVAQAGELAGQGVAPPWP